MEFWGVEVKAGETLRVDPGVGKLLHLSQAALGESKKDKGEPVVLHLKFDTQKLVLGTLSSEKCPNLSFDLVFEQEFELSHNWKNGSIYLAGYKNSNEDCGADCGCTEEGYEGFSGSSDEEESDEELPVAATENGKPEAAKAKPAAAKEAAAKPESAKKVKVVEPSKDEDVSDEDDDDIDSDEEMGDGSDSDDIDEDDEDDDDSDEEEETPTPKKAVGNKKRQAESATKTPVSTKKAKVASPQKTDGKKGGHSATPHPAKKAVAKTSNADKSKSPKSGGEVTCKSCSKSFKSEQAMEAHSKAKHSSGK